MILFDLISFEVFVISIKRFHLLIIIYFILTYYAAVFNELLPFFTAL